MNKKVINNIKNNGYHVFKSVFKKEDLFQYLKIVKNLKPIKQAGFYNNNKLDSKAVLNLQRKNLIFLKLLENKLINEINTYFLNDKYYKALDPKLPNYILSQYAARASGSKKLVLHIDDKVPSSSDNVNYLQWMIPLVATNEKNGCTQIVPKSHKSGTLKPIYNKNKILNLELNVGDMIVIDGRIWHSGGANKTDIDRWVIIITFCKWFFKPHYDIARSFPKKFLKKLNNNLKIILGFASIPKFSEKSGVSQRGDLVSANRFIKKKIY